LVVALPNCSQQGSRRPGPPLRSLRAPAPPLAFGPGKPRGPAQRPHQIDDTKPHESHGRDGQGQCLRRGRCRPREGAVPPTVDPGQSQDGTWPHVTAAKTDLDRAVLVQLCSAVGADPAVQGLVGCDTLPRSVHRAAGRGAGTALLSRRAWLSGRVSSTLPQRASRRHRGTHFLSSADRQRSRCHS
jgi:hypothetical protein